MVSLLFIFAKIARNIMREVETMLQPKLEGCLEKPGSIPVLPLFDFIKEVVPLYSCKDCMFSIFDEQWGEYKCKVNSVRLYDLNRAVTCTLYKLKEGHKK